MLTSSKSLKTDRESRSQLRFSWVCRRSDGRTLGKTGPEGLTNRCSHQPATSKMLFWNSKRLFRLKPSPQHKRAPQKGNMSKKGFSKKTKNKTARNLPPQQKHLPKTLFWKKARCKFKHQISFSPTKGTFQKDLKKQQQQKKRIKLTKPTFPQKEKHKSDQCAAHWEELHALLGGSCLRCRGGEASGESGAGFRR